MARKQEDGKFEVVYADCPWAYANFSETAHGAQKAHYDGMTVEELCAVPVKELWAAKHSVLFLWGTWPKVDEAIDVMRAWGFKHRAGVPWLKVVPNQGPAAAFAKVWEKVVKALRKGAPADAALIPIKPKTGTGFWFQSAAEYLLIGVRGDPEKAKIPILGLLTELANNDRGFAAPIGKHSKKPLGVREWIERKLPDARRLELFATTATEGWTSYGKSLGQELGPWGVRPWDPKTPRKVPLSKKQKAAAATGKPRGPIPRAALAQALLEKEVAASKKLDGETHVTQPVAPAPAQATLFPTPGAGDF